MKYLTAEQIAMRAERFNGMRNTAEINRLFRRQDESHKWPVSNKFNATDRAIRRVRKWRHDGGYSCIGYEYALALDSELSRIVNDEVG